MNLAIYGDEEFLPALSDLVMASLTLSAVMSTWNEYTEREYGAGKNIENIIMQAHHSWSL